MIRPRGGHIGFNRVSWVRRSNDDAEQDFNSAHIPDGSLAAFIGAGNNGFVRTWYDQSDNGRHVGQAVEYQEFA